ncbi:MAG: TIGR02186 family protein [Cohaesibacter sp.]|nr:TIGR02186 family protein [Cohaesibacter sp.]
MADRLLSDLKTSPLSLFLTCLLWVFAFSEPVQSEKLVADLSARTIKITSNFTGSEIVVFGVIKRDGRTVSRAEPYDLIVVVRGKDQKLVSRRKERVVGVWINKHNRTYRNAPTFYALASTRKLEEIAHPTLLTKYQLGTDYLLLPEGFKPAKGGGQSLDEFRAAALRLRRQEGIYYDDLSSISFLSDNLFRSTIKIPAKIPVGQYDVSLYLFRGGALLDQITEPLNISKHGFEQITYSLAQTKSLIYGLICIMIALITGWFAGVVFRKN